MNIQEIKASIRKRHKLADTADVRIIPSSLLIKSIEENDPYKFTARMTTDALDRQDEVVIPQGGDLKEFLQCGIVAWNHNYDQPVGFPNKAAQVIRGADFIEAGMRFMERPADYQGEFFPDFARAFVSQAMKAGINPGVSIGFMPIESRRPSKADMDRYGPNVQCVHSKWKLLELSIAPVQANQEAVVTAVGKGLMKREVAAAVGISVPEIVAKAPVPVPPLPSRVEEIVLVVRTKNQMSDIGRRVQAEVKHALRREFGKVYSE